MKKITELFTACDIDLRYVNLTPIGRGTVHRIYLYEKPGSASKIIKIPFKANRIHSERRDNDLSKQYFREFYNPTEIREGAGSYLAIADYVAGEPLSPNDVYIEDNHQSNAKQLQRLLLYNQELMRERGFFVDLVGLEGGKEHYLGKLGGKPAKLSNVFLDKKTQKLKIIDHDLKQIKPHNSLLTKFVFHVQRKVILEHFGMNYGKLPLR